MFFLRQNAANQLSTFFPYIDIPQFQNNLTGANNPSNDSVKKAKWNVEKNLKISRKYVILYSVNCF